MSGWLTSKGWSPRSQLGFGADSPPPLLGRGFASSAQLYTVSPPGGGQEEGALALLQLLTSEA